MTGRVLTVAESDTSGSAGIQADIKTVLALGGYAMTAVSSVTSQNTQGVGKSLNLEPSFVAEQMRTALGDIGAEAVKIGYLPTEAAVNAVGDVLDDYQNKIPHVVIDPSIVARDGRVLRWRVERSAGDADLDRAVEQMIQRASLPAMPAEMPGDSLTITVPVRFQIR